MSRDLITVGGSTLRRLSRFLLFFLSSTRQYLRNAKKKEACDSGGGPICDEYEKTYDRKRASFFICFFFLDFLDVVHYSTSSFGDSRLPLYFYFSIRVVRTVLPPLT